MLAGVTTALQSAPFRRAPPLFNIPLHVAFADALAAGLLARCGDDPLTLAGALVLLPNRRAVTALTEAFVRQLPSGAGGAGGSGGSGGLLLPRMVPVGDLDDGGFERLASGDDPLPPAVAPLLRRFELARLVGGCQHAAGTAAMAAVERLRLGDALGEVLDQLLAEEVPPEALRAAADGHELANHWQKTLAFLELIIAAWPDARRGHGGEEGATRLAALIDGTIRRWQRQPPAGLVVAAGIANPTPALVRLLDAVLRLPRGLVVLPGLDDDATPAGAARWAAIRLGDPADPQQKADPGHPQWALKLLLARLGLTRADVQPWEAAAGALDGPPARAMALLAALAPAAAGVMPAPEPGARAGLALAECATAAEEAQVVALALREALEEPGCRAALITPDPQLARRVAAHCRRWGITIDSSAGTPLQLTPPGALLLALVEAMAEDFAPARLLAVLKHALVHPDVPEFAAGTRMADIALRGVRPPPGLDAAGAAIIGWAEEKDAKRKQPGRRAGRMRGWWKGVDAALQPLERLREAGEFSLPALMAALRQTMAALAGDAGWAGPDGRLAAALVAGIEAHGANFGPLPVADAPGLMAALVEGQSVRVPGIGHPRLAILGPVEAQLTRADLVVLAGLNEGTWPGRPAPDPWLAPAVRARLGLPGTARAQGLAAQDFLRAASAPRVLITRARRDAGGPQIASRLWLRLLAHVERDGAGIERRDDLVRLARALDGGGSPPPGRPPRPNPPLAMRPRRLSITEVDTLIADPFAFYARRVLGLRALDPLDQDPTPAMRGNLAHDILDEWVNTGLGPVARLLQIAEAHFLRHASHFPLLTAAWKPRIFSALRWAGAEILKREREGWTRMLGEVDGELRLANGIVLTGRIDRVDRHEADGLLLVVDYKTGRVPTGKRVRELEANQLALGLAMAAAGGLLTRDRQPVPGGPAGDIEYWQLKGGRTEAGKLHRPLSGKHPVAAADHVAAALDKAVRLTSQYLLAEHPFPSKLRPDWAWADYDHLARVAEWSGRGAA